MSIVTVIIPVYNGERTILETIASVQNQTFTDFELIVINDGSTDRSMQLLSTIQDQRLKIFSYSNSGLSAARNRGIAHATGEYITFIDADDLWTSDKLELQIKALQDNPKAGLAYSWTTVMDANGEYFHPGTFVSYEGNVYDKLLLSNFIASGSNAMLRRDAIAAAGEFDSTLTSCEDWDYWLRVVPYWEFAVVPKPQILYRQSLGAMSSKIDVMERNHLIVHERAFKAAPLNLQHLENESLAIEYRFLAQLSLIYIPGTEGAKMAQQKLQKAIRLYPKTLLNRKAQALVIKLILIKLLSPKFASKLLQKISRLRAMNSATSV